MPKPRKSKMWGFTDEELLEELAGRKLVPEFSEEMDFAAMERAVERFKFAASGPALKELLGQRKPETRSAKKCPKCGKRTPVKAANRGRTLKTLSGEVVLKRNYHHCERCKHGFYPMDEKLGLSAEGDVSPEMEKRVMDFAINDPFSPTAKRWMRHYPFPISDNLARGATDRVGVMCEESDGTYLQEEMKPPSETPAKVLYVEPDGCMLPTREKGEPWKEAKGMVLFRDDAHVGKSTTKPRGAILEARYVATMGGQEEFNKDVEPALKAEQAKKAERVVWLGDGALWIWNMAQRFTPGCTEILDWGHAVEHGMNFGKAVLGEEDPTLRIWQERLEQLLYKGDNEALVRELMDCLGETISDKGVEILDGLVGYFRNNAARMRYREFREAGLLIGSGVVESSHRHVLQARMKRAGQHWSLTRARRMARLRAAYRTNEDGFYEAIRRAHWRTRTQPRKQRAKPRRRAANQ
jgi:Uncharacterised protein family (UPF0236)